MGACYCTGRCYRGGVCSAYPHGRAHALEEAARRQRERDAEEGKHSELFEEIAKELGLEKRDGRWP